jgi:hypothetical protein
MLCRITQIIHQKLLHDSFVKAIIAIPFHIEAY